MSSRAEKSIEKTEKMCYSKNEFSLCFPGYMGELGEAVIFTASSFAKQKGYLRC